MRVHLWRCPARASMLVLAVKVRVQLLGLKLSRTCGDLLSLQRRTTRPAPRTRRAYPKLDRCDSASVKFKFRVVASLRAWAHRAATATGNVKPNGASSPRASFPPIPPSSGSLPG
jgi:hypothetical protein